METIIVLAATSPIWIIGLGAALLIVFTSEDWVR